MGHSQLCSPSQEDLLVTSIHGQDIIEEILEYNLQYPGLREKKEAKTKCQNKYLFYVRSPIVPTAA